jgi:predicted transcriptional regulator
MVIYPVPVEVTQARIQLLAEQAAKAPPRIINDAVLDVFAAKNQAERDAIVDLKA